MRPQCIRSWQKCGEGRKKFKCCKNDDDYPCIGCRCHFRFALVETYFMNYSFSIWLWWHIFCGSFFAKKKRPADRQQVIGKTRNCSDAGNRFLFVLTLLKCYMEEDVEFLNSAIWHFLFYLSIKADFIEQINALTTEAVQCFFKRVYLMTVYLPFM